MGRRVIVQLRTQAPWLLLLAAVVTLAALPMGRLLARAFNDGGAAFQTMADLPDIGAIIRRTLLLGVGSGAVAILLGVALAWCASLLTPRLYRIAVIVPILPLVIPSVAFFIGWAFLLSPRVGYLNTLLRATPFFGGDTGPFDVYSVPWIVLLTGFNLTSFVYVFMLTGFRRIGSQFHEAAGASGAGPLRTFFTVTLPLLRPSLVYSAGVVLLIGLGQFTGPLLLGRSKNINVLSTEIFLMLGRFPVDFGLGAALGFPILVAGLGVLVLQRFALRDAQRFVITTDKGSVGSERGSAWAFVPLVLYAMVAVVLPILGLAYVALSPFWTGSLTGGDLTLRHFTTVLFDNQDTRSAIWTSVETSVLAVLVVIPLGFLAALTLLRVTRVNAVVRSVIEGSVLLPLGIPAVVMGFGMLFAYTTPPFRLYGTTLVVVLAYVTIMLPYSVRMQSATMLGLSGSFWEASRASGAGPIRTVLQIVLPLCRAGIAGAVAIMFVLLFHEFGVSLMVRSAQTQLMGTIMFDLWTSGTYSEVAAMALVMVAVTAAGVGGALAIAGREGLSRI